MGRRPQRYPWAVGYPPDYVTIGQSFAKYIQTDLKGKKVGIRYQNDDCGKGIADNPIVGEAV